MKQCSSCKTWYELIDERKRIIDLDHDEPIICPVSGREISPRQSACPAYVLGMTTEDYVKRRNRLFRSLATMGPDDKIPN